VKLLVVGAGAIGTLFAARLARAGHSVVVLARPDAAEALRRAGARVEATPPWQAAVEAVTVLRPGSEADAVVLAVKAFDVEGAAESVGRAVRPTAVLLPQNGLGAERSAAAALRRAGWSDPERWIVRAVNRVPATWVAPGVVRPGGSGDLELASAATAGSAAAATERLAALLGAAGFAVRRTDDLPRELWRKAVINAGINPVTALAGVPNGRLTEEPWRGRALALIEEARRGAAAAGVAFSSEELRASFDQIVAGTAANRSSMLQDLDRGRPTEIEAISGEILRAARAHGVELPATAAIVAEVAARSAGSGPRAQPS